MPVRTAVVGDTVQYRGAGGETRNVIVVGTQPSLPAAGDFTVANSGTGGTLTAATYSYKITNVVNGIESAPVASAKTTVVGAGSTNKCTISFPNATATSIYRVYGRVGGSELLIGQSTVGAATFDDTGSVTPAGALPTADARIAVQTFSGGVPATSQAGVLKATTVKGTNVYFKRT
jgi:hypothetical protein